MVFVWYLAQNVCAVVISGKLNCEKGLFNCETFCVTYFEIVLGIWIVHMVFFVKKYNLKLVQDQVL